MRISLFVSVNIKITPWKFRILNPKNSRANIQKQCKTLKSKPTFQEKFKLHGWITREILGLKMLNFQGIVFTWIQTYKEIFKPALVYLNAKLSGFCFYMN